MFDIHKVRPVHGWREFAGEVGIIVLGVLIALSAEAALERWHWHEQVAQSRDTMKDELFLSAMNAFERLAVAPCLRARLVDLSSRLRMKNSHWTGSPMYRRALRNNDALDYVVPPAYAPPSRDYLVDAWKNALSSGSFNHFSNEEANDLSGLFGSISQLDQIQLQEAVAATRLSPLSDDRELSDRDRSDALANVAEVDRALTLIDTVSAQYLQGLQAEQMHFDEKRVRQIERKLINVQQAYRGDCVSSKLRDIG